MKNALCLLALCLSLAVVSCDGIDYWKALKNDPLKWVDRDLPRETIGDDQTPDLLRWNKDDPKFKELNKAWRDENFFNKEGTNLGRPWQSDTPQSWFGSQSFEQDLSKLPTSGQSSLEPWSSTYWPIQYGILSIRYAQNEKNTIVDDNGNRLTWRQSINKYSEPKDYQDAKAAGGLSDYVNKYFSAAEKYDLLVGDTSAFTLTNNNKNQGSEYENSNGDVDSWMGICHGWAPAAFSYPRPQNDVTVTAADGSTSVKFYADDIRGLASLKFASSNYENLFVGGRCNTEDSNIKKDRSTGLILDYDCFDVNPATWTIIIANRMGVNKKSFVIDATFDFQVWNQPVYSYSMSFFNILNDNQGDLESSKVKVGDLASSNEAVLKFIRKMASKKATHLVGVNMDLVYIAETSPSHNPPGADRKVKVTYTYCLELDDQNNILGGEWLQNQHPDFVWAPADGAKPLNNEDQQISSSVSGDISSPNVLKQLTQYAASASSRGEVLDIVVSYLVAQSSASRTLRDSVENEYERLSEAVRSARAELSEFLAVRRN